jgi:hypothetical protein
MVSYSRLGAWLLILVLSLIFAFLGFWWVPILALSLILVFVVGGSAIVAGLLSVPGGKTVAILVLALVVGTFAMVTSDVTSGIMAGLLVLVGLGVIGNREAQELHSYNNPVEKILDSISTRKDQPKR